MDQMRGVGPYRVDRWWRSGRLAGVTVGLMLVERTLVAEVGSPMALVRTLGELGDPWADPVVSVLALMALSAEALVVNSCGTGLRSSARCWGAAGGGWSITFAVNGGGRRVVDCWSVARWGAGHSGGTGRSGRQPDRVFLRGSGRAHGDQPSDGPSTVGDRCSPLGAAARHSAGAADRPKRGPPPQGQRTTAALAGGWASKPDRAPRQGRRAHHRGGRHVVGHRRGTCAAERSAAVPPATGSRSTGRTAPSSAQI